MWVPHQVGTSRAALPWLQLPQSLLTPGMDCLPGSAVERAPPNPFTAASMTTGSSSVSSPSSGPRSLTEDGGVPGVPSWSTSLESVGPSLTSEACARSLSDLFQDPILLTLATESSSHPSGLASLVYQPYVYAGGGLGNMEECPLQSCVAGAGVRRDSINFASACLPLHCRAEDLAASDFAAALTRVSGPARWDDQTDEAADGSTRNATDGVVPTVWVTPTRQHELTREYVTLLQRIIEINGFLGTGWTCGEFRVTWEPWPWGYLYMGMTTTMLLLALGGTLGRRRARRVEKYDPLGRENPAEENGGSYGSIPPWSNENQEASISPRGVAEMVEVLCNETDSLVPIKPDLEWHGRDPAEREVTRNGAYWRQRSPPLSLRVNITPAASSPFWTAFDVSSHCRKLMERGPSETACIDGLRVGSILWIIMGHAMAITSTSGAGFANPSAFLPPHGITTTISGQLLFSSRLAVDTFLCISGFLVVQVLDGKLPLRDQSLSNLPWSVSVRYLTSLPALVLTRMARIIPVYALTLGFYTQIAPHLGQGPFWYQWLALLRPCRDYSWTNFWFINNFVPMDTATTDTCFYHSWYLALDMQLFLLAPLLIFVHQARPKLGRQWTLALCGLSVAITTYLTFVRHWSSNTFDGAAVARFDVEAYAKPHVRAQSYLMGMYVAMLLPKSRWAQRSRWTVCHQLGMALLLCALVLVAFLPATGAYARRPCQYKEWPARNDCGSLWSSQATFLYTAWSRTVWSLCIAALLHLCVGRRHVVARLLSSGWWTPLSRLSFAAYLIHPIVLFVWQLGNTSKHFFRLETFAMDYLSVCVVSFALALLSFLLVEMPCAGLWRMVLKSCT